MSHYELGTIAASEDLIRDLYLNLRAAVNQWATVTLQTPQARMGYVGQHLVSVVTGYPGGRSGARGKDLVMENDEAGEIKTCYRVDQLGQCKDCGSPVSSIETVCAHCGSRNIERKDDSKWIIALKDDQEFLEVIDPLKYYFVLFEFEDLNDNNNNNIVAYIWEVDSKHKGFAYCMIDYYLTIRPFSQSHAPFDFWPYSFKFMLTEPKLIYKSIIHDNAIIDTQIFPSLNNAYYDELLPLTEYASGRNLSLDVVKKVLTQYNPHASFSYINRSGTIKNKAKKDLLQEIEDIRINNHISNSDLCDKFIDAMYLPRILPVKNSIPTHISMHYPDLQ